MQCLFSLSLFSFVLCNEIELIDIECVLLDSIHALITCETSYDQSAVQRKHKHELDIHW
jgi:hypothetical protein